jgi:hypothetical protein
MQYLYFLNIGPENPKFKASLNLIIPIFTKRCFQILLVDKKELKLI